MSCQTDPKMLRGKTPIKRSVRNQTENYKDVYTNDWAQSRVCRMAMKKEAEKREVSVYIDLTSEEGGISEEPASVYRSHMRSSVDKKSVDNKKSQPSFVHQVNAQDPDTDIITECEKSSYIDTALGIFKTFKR